MRFSLFFANIFIMTCFLLFFLQIIEIKTFADSDLDFLLAVSASISAFTILNDSKLNH